MKRVASIRHSGPYKVLPLASGKLEITPQWPQFPKWQPLTGGGPTHVSMMDLAHQVELYLNGGPIRHTEEREE